MTGHINQCLLAAILILFVSGLIECTESDDVMANGVVACDEERQSLCNACGIPDLLDKCCLDHETYTMCLQEVTKKDSQFWKRADGNGFWKREDGEYEEEEDKRAKYFLGKRAKYFLGKRIRNNFLGKRDDGFDMEDDEYDSEDKRARSPFLGKRARSPFLGKRAKYFLGKRDDEYDGLDFEQGFESDEDTDKRAKYFLGKRPSRYFLGKRAYSSWEDLLKRAKYFLGKRSQEKRPKYFLGKRSVDEQLQQNSQ